MIKNVFHVGLSLKKEIQYHYVSVNKDIIILIKVVIYVPVLVLSVHHLKHVKIVITIILDII